MVSSAESLERRAEVDSKRDEAGGGERGREHRLLLRVWSVRDRRPAAIFKAADRQLGDGSERGRMREREREREKD